MKTAHILFLFVISISRLAHAEDVALYDGETYLGCKSGVGDTNIFLNDPNDHKTTKQGFIYLPNGCNSIPKVAAKYLKQVDGQILEMNTVEKAAIDILEGQTAQARKDEADTKLEVGQNELFTAFIQVLNERLPAGQKITKQELIDRIKANR